MDKSLWLCMFVFIVLLGFMNWFSHDKLHKDHVENFGFSSTPPSDVPLENRKQHSKRLQGSPYVSIARKDGPALALKHFPFEADVDFNDVQRERDEGIKAYREKKYKWKVMLKNVLESFTGLKNVFNVLTIANDEIKRKLDTLRLELDTLNDRIMNFKTDQNFNERGISPEHYFNLDKVIEAKQQVDKVIEELRHEISAHIDSKVSTKSNIKRESVRQIMNHVKQLQDQVDTLMVNLVNIDEMLLYCRNKEGKQLPSELVSICNSMNLEGDLGVSSIAPLTTGNMEKAKRICENKKGSCYINNNDPTNQATFVSKNTPYVFYPDRWPDNEPASCVEDRAECLGKDELGCESDTCYEINEHNSHQYYDNKVPRELIEDGSGNLICKSSDSCISETKRIEQATQNCQGPDNGSARYPCWTTTGSPINSEASALSDSWSKTWLATKVGEMTGECSVNNTCRTKEDTDNEVSCLASSPDTQNPDHEYHGNYQCFNNNGSDSPNPTGMYRKSFVQGRWDDANKTWLSADSHCSTNGSSEAPCRTQQDVEDEIKCLSKSDGGTNWDCWTVVRNDTDKYVDEVTLQNYLLLGPKSEDKSRNIYNKVNDYATTPSVNPKNMGKGECVSGTCRKERDVTNEIECYQKNNYQCWDIKYADSPTNKNYNVFTEGNGTMFKLYKRETETCSQNDPCVNSEEALKNAQETCLNATFGIEGEDETCWKINPADINNPEKRGIVEDDNNTDFEGGRRTRFVKEEVDGRIVKGECKTRTCDIANKYELCAQQKINCYSPIMNEDGTRAMVQATTKPNDQDVSMNYTNSENVCHKPDTCSLMPYCSYKIVQTDNGDAYDKNGEGNIDCSTGGATGKQYEWLLESMHDNTGKIINYVSFDTNTQNNTCIRDDTKSQTQYPIELEATCACPTSINDQNYGTHYETRYYTDNTYNDNEGKGYTYDEVFVQGVLCDDAECAQKTVHKRDVKKSTCDGPDVFPDTQDTESVYCDKGCKVVCESKSPETCYTKNTNVVVTPRYQYTATTDPRINVESVMSPPKNTTELAGKGCVDYASPDTDYDEAILKCKETPYDCQYGDWNYTNDVNNFAQIHWAYLDDDTATMEDGTKKSQIVSNNSDMCGKTFTRTREITNNPDVCINPGALEQTKTAVGCAGDCEFDYDLDQCTLELEDDGDENEYEFRYKQNGYAPYNYISGPEYGGRECPVDDNTEASRTTGTSYINEDCCKRSDYEYVYYRGDNAGDFTDTKKIDGMTQDIIDKWNDNTYQCDETTKYVNRRLEKKKDVNCYGASNYNPSSKKCAIPLI